MHAMFQSVPSPVSFPELEETIGKFWKENQIYEKSLASRADAPRFVFYEGPPTANGMPHPGHCLTRAIKDLFPRYRTMRGFRCDRKAGWDTHGLPVEVEVCKELGIHSKEEIEAYGVEPFIHKCRESVWRYMQQWERITERIGFWIHLDEAYVTYHQSYVESVWWALKDLFERGLLYQGHKIVWWWAQGGTALSAGEVGEGYRQVADPSVFVRLPLVDDPQISLLAWTTTPWTLPSNQFAAVHPELEYVVAGDDQGNGKLIVAAALLDLLVEKTHRAFRVESRTSGAALVGRQYRPPFDWYYQTLGSRRGRLRAGGEQAVAWRVVAADFVSTDSGTGVVHQAPAFGEVDFDVLQQEQERFEPGEGPELICCVGPDGRFTSEAPGYEGRWVKEADKDLTRELRHRGLLVHQEQYLHEYPFCPRAENDPLIQYPRRSWFIRTTQFKEKMLNNNRHIRWMPEHIRDGRFGNFLESNVDWALSRERYWGTPLPVWQCEATGYQEAIGSYTELISKPGAKGTDAWDRARRAHPDLPDDLKVHKPYIDAITYDSPRQRGARMRRVPEVIDCWFDSGAMPFAQWGYPHQKTDAFREQFPADFISEALDQTRGWFYSQLAISTLLFSGDGPPDPLRPRSALPHPFRNCVVLGLMLGEDGAKMSKRKRNYREPSEIFDRYGADALRWYFFANQPPWTPIRYNEQAIKDSIPEFLLRLWNVYSFFVIYANIDGFDPSAGHAHDDVPTDLSMQEVLAEKCGASAIAARGELDQWILSELHHTAAAVTESMDLYDNYAACQRILQFVDALSNWYVRRSRDRFWSSDRRSKEKWDAYWTLYACLLTTSRMVAPFVPFLAEAFWQNLARQPFRGQAAESVHLCDFPTGDRTLINEDLSQQMGLVREIASLGRSARMAEKLKVRQPLAKVEVVLAEARHRDWLRDHVGLLKDELNVKAVEFASNADAYIRYEVTPDFKRLGPRLGRRMPSVKKALAGADGAHLLAAIQRDGLARLNVDGQTVELEKDDVQVRLHAKAGWAAAQGPHCVVVLATDLTESLIQEGWARDLVRIVQDVRKDLGCQYTDRIELAIETASPQLQSALETFASSIQTETLARQVSLGSLPDVQPVERTIDKQPLKIFVRVATA